VLTQGVLISQLEDFFVRHGYPPSSISVHEKSGLVEVLDRLSLSFILPESNPPRLKINLISPHLDGVYLSILSNLNLFYELNASAAKQHYKSFAKYISDLKFENKGDSFSWECVCSDSSPKNIFEAVYDACIRPALYVVRSNE